MSTDESLWAQGDSSTASAGPLPASQPHPAISGSTLPGAGGLHGARLMYSELYWPSPKHLLSLRPPLLNPKSMLSIHGLDRETEDMPALQKTSAAWLR